MPVYARDIMTANPVTVSPDTPVAEASKILLEKRFNGLPVVNAEGVLLGIICQSDLVMQQKKFEMPAFFFLFTGFFPFHHQKNMKKNYQPWAAMNVGPLFAPPPKGYALVLP